MKNINFKETTQVFGSGDSASSIFEVKLKDPSINQLSLIQSVARECVKNKCNAVEYTKKMVDIGIDPSQILIDVTINFYNGFYDND